MKKIIAIALFLVGIYFLVDQASLAWTVFNTGGLPVLIDHFTLGVFLKDQILGIVLPIAGVVLWFKS